MSKYGHHLMLFLIFFLLLNINHGLLAKLYTENSDFDLSPFVNPIDVGAVIGDDSAIGLPRLNYIDSSVAFSENTNANMMPIVAPVEPIRAVEFITSTLSPRVADIVPYDVQANQLLDYLNSAGLISQPANTNYLNHPSAVLGDSSQQVPTSVAPKNFNNNNSTNESPLKRQRFQSILDLINSTNRVYFDEERKRFRWEPANGGSSQPSKCFNCTEIRDASECRDIQEIEYFELINLFCCECNANM